MKRLILLFFMITGLFNSVKSQNIITWDLLKNVEFDEVWSEEFQAYYMVPKFSKAIKALDGKKFKSMVKNAHLIPIHLILLWTPLGIF